LNQYSLAQISLLAEPVIVFSFYKWKSLTTGNTLGFIASVRLVRLVSAFNRIY